MAGFDTAMAQIPSDQLARLQPDAHLCCLYETASEQRAVIAPFLQLGLARNEKVLYITDTSSPMQCLSFLDDLGVDSARYLDRGQLVFRTSEGTYIQEGVFDPERMLALLRAEIQDARDAGSTGLRLTGEMTWALRGAPGSERLIEYAARVNGVLAELPCTAICQYNRRRFTPDVLLDVLRVHPWVVAGSRVYKNVCYDLPPEALPCRESAAVLLQHRLDVLAEHGAWDDTPIWGDMPEAARLRLTQFALDHAAVSVFWITPLGEFIYVNDMACEALGYTRAELLEMHVWDVDPDFPLDAREDHWRTFKAQGGMRFETRHRRKDGSTFSVEITSCYLNFEGREFEFAFAQDISPRKLAEAARERSLLAEREQRRLAETLIRATNVLNASLDRERVLQAILDQLAHVVAYDSVVVTLRADEGAKTAGTYTVAAYRGFSRYPTLPSGFAMLPHIQAVTAHHRAVIIPDTSLDPGWSTSHLSDPPLCWMGVPLVVRDRVIGLLNLNKETPGFYTSRHAAIVTAFADQVAIAVENARLYTQVQHDATLKTTLLQELHHRVKNNLQIVSSLFRLQADEVDDPHLEEILRDGRNRVRSIALVHENLYRAPDLANVDMVEYIESEISYLLTVYGAQQYRIVPHLEIDPIVLDVDTAMHCGLIVNELVSNVFKHAFPPTWSASRAPEMYVIFRRVADGCALTVRDNGVGLPAELDPLTTSSLGLNLVAMLTEQLEGTLDIVRTEGATFRLTFPTPEARVSL